MNSNEENDFAFNQIEEYVDADKLKSNNKNEPMEEISQKHNIEPTTRSLSQVIEGGEKQKSLSLKNKL